MPCEWHDIKDDAGNVIGHAHVRRSRGPKCTYPGCTREGTVLCDGDAGDGKTCDRRACRAHAKHIGPDRDLCWLCVTSANQIDRKAGLFV